MKRRKMEKYWNYKRMSHVVLKMTRHTLINKHTDSTHTNRSIKNSRIRKSKKKTSMNQV